jgi:hypothetical protein
VALSDLEYSETPLLRTPKGLRESVLNSGVSLIVGLNHRPLSDTSSVRHN